MSQKTDKIYDRIFKRILTLSSGLVISLINGLFGTDYAADSKLIYNLTENVDSQLKRTFADVIITVSHSYGLHSYHMEVQAYEDDNIIFRMFDYGYHHALNASGREISRLIFPEPVILYLADGRGLPDTYTLTIDFGQQGTFDYRVPVFDFIALEPEEIEQKNLVILLPFYILKLRQTMKKNRSPQILDQLKKLIFDDILGIIKRQLAAGLMTVNDAAVLRELLVRLYNHLYADYAECEEGGLNAMVEDELILQVDVVTAEVTKKVTEEYQQQLADKDKIIQAYRLRLRNVPEEQIAAETGLTMEEIRNL